MRLGEDCSVLEPGYRVQAFNGFRVRFGLRVDSGLFVLSFSNTHNTISIANYNERIEGGDATFGSLVYDSFENEWVTMELADERGRVG